MYNDLRPGGQHGPLKPGGVAYVGDIRLHPAVKPAEFEQAWFCGRFQGVTGYPGPQRVKPDGKPGALKTRMTGKEYFSAMPKSMRVGGFEGWRV